jgi:raffinose/stachyose/melibiose transport system substrate-binding protein
MKKVIALLTGFIMAASVLTGCGAASSASTAGSASAGAGSSAATSLAGTSITFLNSKGEVQEPLEEMAAAFEDETGIKVEITACGAGEVPYTKITTMYNSGNAPTMAMLDTTDIIALAEEYALDLSGEKWISECEDQVTKVNDKVYSFPFCIEGRGLIYNKAAIEKALGTTFDPAAINSFDALKQLLEDLRAGGMEYPVILSSEDWSLGAHQLGFIYDAYDGTTAGSADIINQLEDGLDPLTYDRFNEFVDTIDLLNEYNYNYKDPLGADYDQNAMNLADGDVAIWANGCWAWPNIAEGGASTDDEYGFLPFVLGNDTSDFANNGMQASASKQVMIDNVQATAEQQAAAKEFLSWIVYSDNGQKMMVENCAIIPACTNNAYAPLDPLGADIVAKMADGKVYSSSFIAPSDHWSVMGAAMQKYIAGQSTKDELAKTLSDYWTSQK